MRRSATRSCRCGCSSRGSRSSTRPTPASTSTRCGSSPRASTAAARSSDVGVLLITHYTRILRYIKPDFVHVFVAGRIVEEGGPELAEKLENEGYAAYVKDSNEQASREAAASRPHDPDRLASRCRGAQAPLPLDVEAIRADFPILTRTVRDGKRLVYLDSGATSQKPRQVLDAERWFYENINAAPHRGAHQLAEEATGAYEAARATIGAFIGAPRAGDRLHPQQHRGDQPGRLRAVQRRHGEGAGVPPVRRRPGRRDRRHRDGAPRQPAARGSSCASAPGRPCAGSGSPTTAGWTSPTSTTVVNERTKLVAVTQQSNILGTINPLGEIVARAHEVGALVLVDGAQSVPHQPVDVSRAGRGLPGLLRAQDARAHRRRRALGPLRGARRAAAVPHRRLDDRGRADGGQHLRRPAAALRGRRADDRAGRSGWPRPSSTCRRSAWTTSRRTSRRSPATRWRSSPRSRASP